MARPGLVVGILVVCAMASVGAGASCVRRAPGVALALFGAAAGGVFGFVLNGADAPGDVTVPLSTSVGASVGLVAFGGLGVLVTRAPPPAGRLRRAAIAVLVAAPFAAGGLTAGLQVACPLYVSGPASGLCDFGQVDQFGGWIAGVVAMFVFDAVFLVALLLASAARAGAAAVDLAQDRNQGN